MNFQGEWKPKMIDNPAYKGEWIHPEIDNPDYAPDAELYKYDDIGAIGFDLWQVLYIVCCILYIFKTPRPYSQLQFGLPYICPMYL